MNRFLEGKAGVVVGASSGIGEATAKSLAEEGAKVAVLTRRSERLDMSSGLQAIMNKNLLGVSLSLDLPLYVVFPFWPSNAQGDVMIANTIDHDGVLQEPVEQLTREPTRPAIGIVLHIGDHYMSWPVQSRGYPYNLIRSVATPVYYAAQDLRPG